MWFHRAYYKKIAAPLQLDHPYFFCPEAHSNLLTYSFAIYCITLVEILILVFYFFIVGINSLLPTMEGESLAFFSHILSFHFSQHSDTPQFIYIVLLKDPSPAFSL